MLTGLLLLIDLIIVIFLIHFYTECLREKEPRAPKVAAAAVVFFVLLSLAIVIVPPLRMAVALGFLAMGLIGLLLLIPPMGPQKALAGARGWVSDSARRYDERDQVFARQRLLPEQLPQYRQYYDAHPAKEPPDTRRRAKGLLGVLGAIDNAYQPHTAMVHAAFELPDYLGPQAIADPLAGEPRREWDRSRAADLVKEYTRHLGADAVGICKVDPLWVYSHRGEIHYGNWQEWGRPLADFPTYAVVFLTEMDWEHVSGAPHTATVAESANDYAKGAYISTVLARWFAHMGYRGVAQHTRNYDTLLVPLAVDAGLGEMGRQGYLIAPEFGARTRVFATLTDMPLRVDKPISIGVDEFCEKCKKCAESCPSKSIPLAGKVVHNGIERWKLNEDSCFEYWCKVGTDCSICMAVCPFSRPNTLSHRMVRLALAQSGLARRFFPVVDNLIYGRRWKPKPLPRWLDTPKAAR